MSSKITAKFPVKPKPAGRSRKAARRHNELLHQHDRDVFNLARLLRGARVGATPVSQSGKTPNKWAESIDRLRGLGWDIYEQGTNDASTYFSLTRSDIEAAGSEGRKFAANERLYYTTKADWL